jgi:SAM-dependent methyltransferase
MQGLHVDRQYSTGLSQYNIARALLAAGKDLNHVDPADLGMVEDFHTLGRIATREVADRAGIRSDDAILDAGSGIGGTARFLANQYGCKVTSVDLTEEYCETARWLNRLVHVDDRISVRQGDVTDLPFRPESFDVVISQHVQMNVADKSALYREARRVLVTGGRLAIWDVTDGAPGALGYPLPWADAPELSYLVSADRLREVIEAARFDVVHWNDLTEQAAPFMQAFLSASPGPLGLHTFIDNFAEKANNLTAGLVSGRLRVIQGVAQAVV